MNKEQTLAALRAAIEMVEKEDAQNNLSRKISAVARLDYIHCIFKKYITDPKFTADSEQIKSVHRIFFRQIEEIRSLRKIIGLKTNDFRLEESVKSIIHNVDVLYDGLEPFKEEFKIKSPVWFDLYMELGF